MRLGFTLPQVGETAGPEAVVRVAQRAEALGYDSVWVLERLLYPVAPRTPYPVTPDGSLPEGFKIVLDPLETLTYAAAHTERIALGTSVLNIPYYNPVMLARRLTTLDVLSGGRLRVGLGLGWSEDEYEATGASMKNRGRRADEFLRVLKAIWTSDPAEFQGAFYRVPKSIVLPKPVQKPHPPVFLAAYSPGGLRRAATLADGWNPSGIPVAGMKRMMESLRAFAREAGRDPSEVKVVVRGNLRVTGQPLGKERAVFTGAMEEIGEDIAAVREMGAHELFFDAQFSPDGASVESLLARMETLKRIA